MTTRVQIVDDHFLFAEALGSVIRELPDFDLIGIAVTGPQALSMAQEKQPQLVLLDFHLPGYSADTLAPRLRQAAPGLKIVILTSDTSEESMVKGVRAGADGFLTKDRALDDVLQILNQVSQGQSALTAHQAGAAATATNDGGALTQREVEILRMVGEGRDSVAIADALTISSNTVRTHLQNIFSKLGAHSKLEAVAVATRRGLLR